MKESLEGWILHKLKALCDRPEMFGDSPEVEAQVMLLLELWSELSGKGLREEYSVFCREHMLSSKWPLHGQVKGSDLPGKLKVLVSQVTGKELWDGVSNAIG